MYISSYNFLKLDYERFMRYIIKHLILKDNIVYFSQFLSNQNQHNINLMIYNLSSFSFHFSLFFKKKIEKGEMTIILSYKKCYIVIYPQNFTTLRFSKINELIFILVIHIYGRPLLEICINILLAKQPKYYCKYSKYSII